MRFEHYSPTRIVFGRGKLGDLPNFLPTDAGRILVVTGKRSSKENGSLEVLQDSLKRAGKVCFVFDKVEQNPSTKTVNTGARFAREKSPEIVVGLGGGSAMDAAKCIALLIKNDGNIEDYIRGKKAQNSPLPMVAIPTTAGTGSEVTQYAVVTDYELETKGSYAGSEIFPVLALLDPELTLSMPKGVTMNTGMDALTHAIEGYLSNRATPISDILALESVKIIKETLPKVAVNGNDIDSSARMLYASMLAGLVISQTRTIILHALGYPLTTLFDIPHGRANGILLPYVLDFLMDAQGKKISKIIEIFEGKDSCLPTGKISIIGDFVNSLGISTHLSDYGIKPSDLPRFIQDVLGRKRNLEVTLKKITREDIANLYKRAL